MARRHDAAVWREQALAYTYAYQQRQPQEEKSQVGLGFQWLERWMAAQALDHAAKACHSGAAPAARMSTRSTLAGGGVLSEKTVVETVDASFRSPVINHMHRVQLADGKRLMLPRLPCPGNSNCLKSSVFNLMTKI